MKKYLLGLLMLFGLAAQAATPTLTITAANTVLQKDQTTLVTIVASEAIAGFALSDLNILGNGAFTTILTVVNPTTYTVTFQKTTDMQSAAIVVDNKAYSAVSDGALGVYAQLGFNPQTVYYVEQGGNFLLSKVRADPQPIRLKVGEMLVNAADNAPVNKLFERYYTIERNTFRAVSDKTLFRVQAGQKIIAKFNPKPHELLNQQGAHNHGLLTPKATYIDVRPTIGTNLAKLHPSNACNADVNGNHHCSEGDAAGTGGGGGTFRIVIQPSHISADDPIVYPNVQGRAHTHTFFANKSVNYQTTNATLLNSSITTASGGAINRSAYWAPSLIDTATNTILFPQSGNFYYKSNAPIDMTEPLPQGLKGIAGNPNGTSVSTRLDNTRFECGPRTGSTAPSITSEGVIPECSGKDYHDMNLFIGFTNCLADDGAGKIKLDSPDHRSHWRPWNDPTPSNLANGCTTAFPHRITNLVQNMHYTIPTGANTKTWRLSSDNYSASLAGGASLHADYWAMWSKTPYDWMARLTDQCNNTSAGCEQNYIGMNDGITIASITAVGNVGTAVTVNPHQLKIGLNTLRARISGVSGTDAAAYNFIRSQVEAPLSLTTPKKLMPFGSQLINVTGANTFTYTLNSTPTDTSKTDVELTGAKVQWGEGLCFSFEEGSCSIAYNAFYYPMSN